MILPNYKNGRKIKVFTQNDRVLCADGKMYVHGSKLWVVRIGELPVTFPITYVGIVPFIIGFYIEDYFYYQHNKYMASITNDLPF